MAAQASRLGKLVPSTSAVFVCDLQEKVIKREQTSCSCLQHDVDEQQVHTVLPPSASIATTRTCLPWMPSLPGCHPCNENS